MFRDPASVTVRNKSLACLLAFRLGLGVIEYSSTKKRCSCALVISSDMKSTQDIYRSTVLIRIILYERVMQYGVHLDYIQSVIEVLPEPVNYVRISIAWEK